MVTKQVIVATEASDFQQAIYVEGLRRWEGGTAVSLDIVTAVGTGAEAIALRCVNVDLPEDADGFPESLEELRPYVSPVEEPLGETPQRPSVDELMALIRDFNDATNPLLHTDVMELYRARGKAQKLLAESLRETEA